MKDAGADNVGGVLRLVEAHPDVALGSQVVDLVRNDLGDQLAQIGAVAQISIVEVELLLRTMPCTS